MFKAKQKTVSLLVACLTLVLTMLFGFATLFTPTPLTTASAATATVTDTLTVGITGATSTTYITWTDKDGGASDAVYAGNSSKTSDGAIQMRSKSNSGIVTTASGGKAKKVVVAWNNGTSNGRTLNIYGKNTAYTAPTELYSASTQGSLLGTIVKGTSTELTISGDYEYIGMRSASNAMYLTSITIDWEVELAEGECAHENETEEITTPATCTTDGEKTFTCASCGNVRTEAIKATGHDTTEEITTAATCTTAGEKAITCNDCDYKATEVIPALGHDYVDGKCTVCGAKEPVEQTLTLTFDNTAKRTEYSTTQQVWEENGITLTNTGSVGNYYNPARFYANSKIVIGCANMIKIEFTCNTAAYATVLKNSIGNTATVSGAVVTVEFDKTDSYEIKSLTAQIRMDSITVYTNACAHENQTTTTVDATCTKNGSTTVTCDDCGATVSTEEIPATGHNLDEGVITTQPDVGVEGVKTYTCQNGCGYTETESIPALNAVKYTLTYSVPNNVEAPDSVELANGENITLPSLTAAPEGFTFLGWATEEYMETKTAPTYLTAESDYTLEAEEDVTLYALFAYSVGSGNFVKVTEAPTDWSGEYLIVYEDGAKAYVFNATDAANGYVSATITDSSIAYSDALAAETVTIAAMSGGYSILTKNGYIYGTSGSNALNFNESAQLNTVSFTEKGEVDIISNTSHLRFNSASNGLRFRYYKSSSYTAQKAISLYALDGATYYATSFNAKTDSASITVGADFTLNYYVTMDEGLAENAKMYISINGGEEEEVSYTTDGGRYKFSLNIPPQCMADLITATLKSNGLVLDSTEYSIQTYAKNQLTILADKGELTEGKDIALKQLLSNMLYYGAAAQNYKDYNTGKLATNGMEELLSAKSEDAIAAPGFKTSPVNSKEVDSYPVYFTNAKVWFGDVNKIYIQVNDIAGATLSVNGGEQVKLTSHTITTEGLLATQFDTKFTFALYHNGVLMQTLTYSVNAYAYNMQKHETMGALAKALYYYGVSAKAYAPFAQ